MPLGSINLKNRKISLNNLIKMYNSKNETYDACIFESMQCKNDCKISPITFEFKLILTIE